ncbi:hypothetical protein KAW43_00675 [Candidatus Parcubacteria bacterium]|nr:hypothetical protein [Candidatus Parcubacteria bacterium]
MELEITKTYTEKKNKVRVKDIKVKTADGTKKIELDIINDDGNENLKFSLGSFEINIENGYITFERMIFNFGQRQNEFQKLCWERHEDGDRMVWRELKSLNYDLSNIVKIPFEF